MEDMNGYYLVGRLTRDAELKYTTSGTAVANLSIATNRSVKDAQGWKDEVSFFEARLWGKRAEAMQHLLLKGVQLSIDGKFHQERWESEGTKRSKLVLNVDKIQLFSSKPINSGAPSIEPQFTDDVPF